MNYCWTSKKTIYGLRHFVLLNEVKEKKQINFLLVSVLDVDIALQISYEELMNNGDWSEGWLNLSKAKSITKDYEDYKLTTKREAGIRKIFINENSLFNIS